MRFDRTDSPSSLSLNGKSVLDSSIDIKRVSNFLRLLQIFTIVEIGKKSTQSQAYVYMGICSSK